MTESWAILQLFPENGLDRSLHAPVFIGLLFLSIFRETLGWTFAGLVVPGYLAAVLLAAPVTAALVIVEATLTYILALLLGRTLPRTGAWFTFFGRERFLLLIASASLVRLGIEATLLPALVQRWDMTHSRELYSLGLVLVPLLANSFWNAGFVRAFPRVGLVTGLTYLVVAELLLPYTNFTLSRFQVANESVSLAFLESPHAHIILLVGAILAARNNVKYGWDYSGILVPALLAVAWYQPTKVATTLIEAMVVYYVSMATIRVPPFSKWLIVGSRRILLTFTVGFVLKYVSGSFLAAWWPHVQLIDFFGFGYLLPSLLANKMWDRGSVANVIMPTLQVSVMAFPLGILLGFGLRSLEVAPAFSEVPSGPDPIASVPLALMLGDTAPSPHRSGTPYKFSDAYAVGRQLAERSLEGSLGAASLSLAARARLRVARSTDGGWMVLTPLADDPNLDAVGPRAAIRTERRYGDDWLLVVEGGAVGAPNVALAFQLARRMGARALVVVSRLDSLAARDEAFGRELAETLGVRHRLRIRVAPGVERATLSAVSHLPHEVSPAALSDALGVGVRLDWRAPGSEQAPVFELTVPRASAEAVAARQLGAPAVQTWALADLDELSARVSELSYSSPAHFRPPSVPQLRFFGSLLEQRLERPQMPSAWQRALAHGLGLRFARLSEPFAAWVLYEEEKAERRGSPTLIQRIAREPPSATAKRLAVSLAAPRWQLGGIRTAARVFRAFDADLLVVHGTLVNVAPDGSSDPRRPTGARSLFQRAIETWLNAGGASVIVRGIPASQPVTTDAVITFDAGVTDLADGPAWSAPLIERLRRAGIRLAPVDGTAERSGFEANRDPGVAYARRFAPGRMMVLWLSPQLRQSFQRARTGRWTRRRLTEPVVRAEDPEAFLERLRRCGEAAAPLEPCAFPTPTPRCRQSAALAFLGRFRETRNPHFLEAALAQSEGCGWVSLSFPDTRTTWLAIPPSYADPSVEGAPTALLLPLLQSSSNHGSGAYEPHDILSQDFSAVRHLALSPLHTVRP